MLNGVHILVTGWWVRAIPGEWPSTSPGPALISLWLHCNYPRPAFHCCTANVTNANACCLAFICLEQGPTEESIWSRATSQWPPPAWLSLLFSVKPPPHLPSPRPFLPDVLYSSKIHWRGEEEEEVGSNGQCGSLGNLQYWVPATNSLCTSATFNRYSLSNSDIR